MRIAIVDDTKSDRDTLTAKLKSYLETAQADYSIDYYISAEQFLESFKPRTYDIVFLDIYMEKLTGMDAAQVVFNKDSRCKIIFITTSEDYLRKSFSVRAVYYLLKPIRDDEFRLAMQFCLGSSDYDVSAIEIRSGQQSYTIATDKILYIDVNQHTTCIHLIDKDMEVHTSFADITKNLKKDKHFLFCSRGVAVNLQFVTDMLDDVFIIDGKYRVPFSRRSKNEMKKAWHDFVYSDMQ